MLDAVVCNHIVGFFITWPWLLIAGSLMTVKVMMTRHLHHQKNYQVMQERLVLLKPQMRNLWQVST
jgi:hypothetical protein